MRQFNSKEYTIYDLIRREGGLVDNPNDRGGITKFGISKRSYPELDIIHLSKNDAYDIYDRDFWNNGMESFWEIDRLIDWLRPVCLDMYVNHGGRGATLILQRVIKKYLTTEKFKVDGLFGSKTFSAVSKLTDQAENPYNDLTPGDVILMLVDERIRYYMALIYRDESLRDFEGGWISRARYFL